MATEETTKKDDGRRPSRLLNLNKSPQVQKLLAATNAKNSPFFRLPFEVRESIYDYAFGSCIVYAYVGTGGYLLTSCSFPQEREASLPPRVTRSPDSGDGHPAWWYHDEEHDDCSKPADDQNVRSLKIPVHLLQVCRQIYHEAALKPFTEATFGVTLDGGKRANPQFGRFLATLVPTQARAIAHLRICILSLALDDHFLSSTIASHFEGLKHVEIHIETQGHTLLPNMPLLQLQKLEHERGFTALKRLDLKSLRLTVGIWDIDPTEVVTDSILEWIGRLEVGITHAVVPSEHQGIAAVTELE